jgi:hypothetical protein
MSYILRFLYNTFIKKKNDLNEEFIIISKDTIMESSTDTNSEVMNLTSCTDSLDKSSCNSYYFDLTVGNYMNIIKWMMLYYSIEFVLNKYNRFFHYRFNNVSNYADLICASINTIYFLQYQNLYVIVAYYFYDLLRMFIQKEKDLGMVIHHITTLIGISVCTSNTCYTILINNTVNVKKNDIFLYSKKLIENSPFNYLFPRLSNILVICLTSTTTFWWLTYRTYNLLTFKVPSVYYTTLQYSLLTLNIGYTYFMIKSLRTSIKKFIQLNKN